MVEKPAQIGFCGYKFATCCSINNEVCHGLPRNYILKNEDLIKIDMCVELNGALSDSCWAYVVGKSNNKIDKLMYITKNSLYIGIKEAYIGNFICNIGNSIQKYIDFVNFKKKEFSIVEQFVGHGIGPTIHEDPMILHYKNFDKSIRLKEGMVITIEPMINFGKKDVFIGKNGWTAYTKDNSLSCQFEHTIAITKNGPLILTFQK